MPPAASNESENLLRAEDPLDPESQGTEPLACVLCRARKLKCDRTKPACSRCIKVNNECVYPESRRKPAARRKNVKELEARLAQVEDYLKEVTKNGGGQSQDAKTLSPEAESPLKEAETQFTNFDFSTSLPPQNNPVHADCPLNLPDWTTQQDDTDNFHDNSQLMGLGLSESLPPFEVMEELNSIYFSTQHYYIPVVHPGRYLQAFYGGPLRKPPMCLQYVIWAMAAYFNDKYNPYADVFYQRARQYADADEMKGSGEHFITLFHAQAYAILASFEAKSMLFTRAAMTSAKSVRLVQMMGLDRLDGDEDDIPPSLAPALSWAEMEERRRAFWGAFTIDAHASISTGWPSLIQTCDITTRLPASEDAFINGREEPSAFVDDVFKGASYSGFASAIVMCCVFKEIMYHVHRSKPRDKPEDIIHGQFWERHRKLDNELSGIFMFLPENLRLPGNIRDPSAIHTNLNMHASVICLHHAAIEKAEKHGHVDSIKHNSVHRLRTAAEGIANIVKMTSHNSTAYKSPLCAMSLYCAVTVFIFLAKENPNSGLTTIETANLEIIIQSMEGIGRVHQVTKAFLQQACLDIERNGLSRVIRLPGLSKYRDIFGGLSSNIPLLARSPIGRHTKISPVLPGRLPLDRPEGRIMPTHLRLPRSHPAYGGTDSLPVSKANCFSAVLGAVTRNIAPDNVGFPINPAGSNIYEDNQSHKRKRMATTPDLDSGANAGMAGMSSPDITGVGADFLSRTSGDGTYTSGTNIGQYNPMQQRVVDMVLPDRTNPSGSSSPLHRDSGVAETLSGSSGTSPGVFGLGNTLEENRFDFRSFQHRITTPLWPTEQELFGQVTESMANNTLAAHGNDPWGILNGEINYSGGN